MTEEVGHTTARGGLPLVVETMRGLGLERAISEQVQLKQRSSGYSEVEKVEAHCPQR